MLRASDVMELLIEKAQEGDDTPSEKADKVLVELKEMSGAKPEEPKEEPATAEPAETAAPDEPEEEDIPLNVFSVLFKPKSNLTTNCP